MSSTVTQIRQVAANRPHDHVYDPVYTVSNMGAHLQEHNATRMSMVERVPNYDNMFSVLNSKPRHMYRVRDDRIPIAAFPPAGSIRQDHGEVLGAHRIKFYKRPVVPFMHAVPTEFLVVPQDGSDAGISVAEQAAEVPLTRTIGVQTMYRESQTQTDPYTADYITSPGQANPEVLAIAHLTYGNGLPASMEEIQLIQRLREKKDFEASLPPITDEQSMLTRKKMLEARELKEWAIREDEMQKEQQEKLQILIDTLKAREDKVAMLNEARVELVRQEKMEIRDKGFEEIHHDRQKAQRQLHAQRHPKMKGQKRDIIVEFAEHGSKVYAPMARDGRMPVKNQVVDYGIPLINNFQGLIALERTLPDKATRVDISKPEFILPVDRKAQKIAMDLAYVDQLVLDKKEMKSEKAITNVYKRFEPVIRPPMPVVEVPEDQDLDRSLRLLQRLLRGRAVQNVMFAGKEKAMHLIKELRLSEDASKKSREIDEEEEDAKHMEAATDALQGEVISHALDFLAKEMVRQQEERKIMKFYEHAQWSRRTREAEESGRRQTEYVMRMKKEDQFKRIMDVHYNSADRFLDQVIRLAVDHSADDMAVAVATLKKNHVDPIEDDLEKANNDSHSIVADLLSSLVMPQVARHHVLRAEKVKNRRLVDASHKVAWAALTDMNLVNANKPSIFTPNLKKPKDEKKG